MLMKQVLLLILIGLLGVLLFAEGQEIDKCTSSVHVCCVYIYVLSNMH